MTLSIDIQHNSIECQYADCRYAECRDYLNVMLSIFMLNVVMLSDVAPIFMLKVTYTECHISALYAECRYAECRGAGKKFENVL